MTATNSSGTARALVADLTGTTTTLMDSPLAGPSEGFADISADGTFALVTSAQTDPANPVSKPIKLYKVSLQARTAFSPLVAPARLLDTPSG